MKALILFFTLFVVIPLPAFAKKDAKEFFTKGESYFHRDKFLKAKKLYQKAVKADGEKGAYWLALGMAEDALGEFDAAIKSYQQSLAFKDTEKHIAYNNLGVSYGKLKKHDQAIKALLQSVKINPKYSGAYYNLGIAYYRMGKKHLARQQFEKLKKLGEMDMAQVLWEKIYQ